jgi:chemotaxis protein CheD
MSSIVVGVGGIGVSRNPEDVIKTFALGSCVGVMIYSPMLKIGGMVHVALPESTLDKEKARITPGYFADSGIPALLKELKKIGANGNLMVKLTGGANVMDEKNVFNIGKRNVLNIRKILWQLRLAPHAEDVGGTFSRTVTLEVGTGKVTISSPARGQWEL